MNGAAWQQKTVNANGRRINLRLAGSSGPLVLLCHGFPESWYSWHHQLEALSAAGYRAVALDMPGFGRSAKPAAADAYSVIEVSSVCAAVVEALGEKTAVIVGHDLGAPVAWTAAWTRPEIFRAVVGMSVPFSGRGVGAMLGSPFGEIRPSEAGAKIAGPGRMFYHEYFAHHTDDAVREAEQDMRTWLTAALYSLSASRPLPPPLAGADLTRLPPDILLQFVGAAMSVPLGQGMSQLLEMPKELPAWLKREDLDYFVAELEYGGLAGPLNYYKNFDRDWERLESYQNKPLAVPALFIGGDRDIVTIWSQEAIARADEMITDLRGRIIIPNCGHWIQQEQPEAVNKALIDFLKSL